MLAGKNDSDDDARELMPQHRGIANARGLAAAEYADVGAADRRGAHFHDQIARPALGVGYVGIFDLVGRPE